MNILLLNPNMSVSMTESMHAVAESAVSPSVQLVPVTASRGFPYISSRAEAQIAGGLVLEMLAEHQSEADAAVIAAFGDLGLAAAREIFNIPVIGMAQAAITAASMLGERFSIVTFSPQMSRWYLDSVESSGLGGKFAGVRTPESDSLDPFGPQESMHAELLTLIDQAVNLDGADIVILGGAPLAGIAPLLQPSSRAVLVDPIACAVTLAESMTRITDKIALGNRRTKPAAKPTTGLSPSLAAIIERE